ncbi:FERM, ARHGEF and pleckstrin domain-containing protein 1-like isoform X2 [Agrilus planipennis]|uniref:FERM, ARHGEF and pleckstrin domain-containing protein 1-like isoform X2 n=1 Tax=Agrilus planipennis TaxID=224129 RepID=A0A7F5RHL3_AGRPL|nr:FERM, ARHGEF and pleckstrin domain-containing protein 1-like isoform X2 [Agrilus planipennis]
MENNNLVYSIFTPNSKTKGNELKINGDRQLSTSNGDLDSVRNIITDIEGEVKKKRVSDKSYFIAKEILMTEITYKKDLDVINIWFRDEVGKEEPEECSILLTLIAPLAQAHGILVRDLEQRLQNWDGRGGPKTSTEGVADVLLTHLPPLLPIYEEYLDGHILVLEKLDSALKSNNRFEQFYRDFETQKVCYLPFTSFVLKPLHRLLQYQNILQSKYLYNLSIYVTLLSLKIFSYLRIPTLINQ